MKTLLEHVYRAGVLCLALLFCVAGHAIPAAAQDAAVPAVTIIHAGKLFDAKAGRMLDNQDILIRGDKIVQVGPNIAVPAGAEEIDLRKATVLPGFIELPRAFDLRPARRVRN